MTELIASQARKSRFDRPDDSAEFIIEAMGFIRHGHLDRGKVVKLKFHELRRVAEFKANGYKIKKGQIYVKQFNKQDGRTYTFNTLPDILRICIKYKLYGDD